MSVAGALSSLRDTVLRLLPHRAPTGLLAVGRPGRDAPVLVTGNYTLTVKRLRRALRDIDAWLLCTDSNGINVWCAAGGGHLTHHDVVAAIRTSQIGDRVAHRELILPQLAATGVERHRVAAATGWRARWGPAHLDDLPAYLRRGRRVHRGERLVRFPLRDRLEMGLVWALPMVAIAMPIAGALAGWRAGVAVGAAVAAAAFGPFGIVPRVGVRRHRRAIFAVDAGLGALAGGVALAALDALGGPELLAVAAAAVLAPVILQVDFEGSTPWYGSVIGASDNPAHVELVAERCRGAADCVAVCPKGVFAMDGRRRSVAVARPAECLQCGACVVQCPNDALRFRYEDGRVLGPEVIRTTRLNLAGRRAVQLDEPAS